MLVCNCKRVASAQRLAEVITLAAFGALPDPELNCPFVQLVNGTQFFCFEFQFSMQFKETETEYQFSPNWHCERKDAIEREKAIVALYPHLFARRGPAEGF